MFHAILVATDFSDCAERAVRIAAAWAERQSAALEVVHVFDPPTRAIPGGGRWLTDDAEAAHRRELTERLEASVSSAMGRVTSVTTRLLEGRPHDAIVQHAAATKADLVVIGARGLGRVEVMLLGSVADRVLRSAPCSVLLIPEDAQGQMIPRTIVAPTDFSRAAIVAVDRARSIARELGARLDIVHAWELPKIPRHELAIAEDIAGAALVEVRTRHPLAGGVELRYLAHQGAPTDVILAHARQEHADLIVMAPHDRRGVTAWLLGSVTDRVARSSTVPVLVLRG